MKRPIFALLGFGIIFVGFVLLARQVSFLATAIRTTGTVQSVTASNGSCGGGRRRSKYACTKYTARVEFIDRTGNSHVVSVPAGDSRGHNQATTYSYKKVGGSAQLLYAPSKPGAAYEDTYWNNWGSSIIAFIAGIGSFFSSFTENRTRR